MRPSKLWILTASLTLSVACDSGEDPKTDTEDTQPTICTDLDEDEVCEEDGDCADDPSTNPWAEYTYPGADEIPYNGNDEDCDGEDLTDYDGDGFDGPSGEGEDCNDSNPNVYPDAEEECYSTIDMDCDGIPAEGEVNYDCDFDGYVRTEDCDDENADAYPGNDETWYDGVDGDCDYWSDYDQDQDGDDHEDYGGSDCDDEDPLTSGANGEIWDGTDRNCDDTVDNLNSREQTMSWFGSSGADDGNLGTAVAFTEDLDGDGLAEVFISDLMNTEGDGKVYLVTPSTVAEDETAKADDYQLAAIQGDSGSAGTLGWHMEVVSDYDGDGIGDLLVTAPFYEMRSGDIGQSFIYSVGDLYAAADDVDYDDNHISLRGSGYSGFYASGLGDLDGDGYDEIGVSSINYAGIAAITYVYAGSDVAEGDYLKAEDAAGIFESSSHAGGDIIGGLDMDGDGTSDTMLASFQSDYTFAVHLLSGDEGVSGSADYGDFDEVTISNTTGYDKTAGTFGAVILADLGDLNGDGHTDLAISSTHEEDALATWGQGAVYVVSAEDWEADAEVSDIAWLTLENEGSAGGLRLEKGGVGDYDGDGAIDALVSEPGYQDKYFASAGGVGSSGKGSVYYIPNADLVAGGTITASSDYTSQFKTVNSGVGFGNAVATGDVNGDGDDDAIFGAFLDGTGSAYLYASYLYAVDEWHESEETDTDTGDTGDTDSSTDTDADTDTGSR